MKRLFILAILILGVASFAGAQNEACPTCNKGRELVTTPTHNTEDDNRWRTPARGLYARFYASVVVTNDTAKKIKRIIWETELVDSGTRESIYVHTFVTRKRIDPHQVVTLNKKIEIPLAPGMVSGSQAMQVRRGIPNVIRTEQVSNIREIQYTDGSVSSP